MKSKAMRLAIAGLLIAAAAAAGVLYHQQSFTGSCTVTPSSYRLDIERMTGTDKHALELDAGDALQIRFEARKGAVRMEIRAPDLYAGNGKETTDFSVSISESGSYTVAVEARGARGEIYIQAKKKQL